jgi:hypothetical protein
MGRVPLARVADLAAHLAGTWAVERDLHDRRAGVRGRFSGTAAFVPGDGGLRWRERGRLAFGGFDGPAARELVVAGGPGRWEVRFGDGRPFHPLDLAAGRAVVEHPCGADTYAGTYEARGPDLLVVRWRVTGPAKDLLMHSRYARRAGDGAA